MTAEAELLTLHEAAGRLGVHYMTVYRYVRTGRLEAYRRAGRWLVDATEADRLRDTSGRRSVPNQRSGRHPSAAVVHPSDRLLGRLVEGDGPGCWAIVEEALVTTSPTDVYLKLLAPSLRSLGRGWADGTLSIADEHRATASALRLAGRLSALFSRPGRRRWGTVVLAGAPGDLHVLPVAMVGDVLRGEGYDVVDLGADVPCATLLEVVNEMPDLLAVGLSVSVDRCLRAAGATLRALHEAYPGVPVLVGGPAVPEQWIAQILGADHWAPDAAAVARLVGRLSGLRQHPVARRSPVA